ncbi:MAG: hypothetical protein WDZ90_00225 [Candidatus Paceibacterota bacterium]
MAEEKASSIERLRNKLYSRKGIKDAVRRRVLSEKPHDVKQEWEKETESESRPSMTEFMARKKKKITLPKLLWVSVGFFVLALSVSALFFFGGTNTVSGKNIIIEVEGPSAVAGGEELPLQISIRNRNATPIKFVDLLVEFPEGTRSATNLSLEFPRHRESLDTINPGEQVNKTVRAILFGEENTQHEIKITVEYRIDGSNAIFFKEDVYPVVISSAPLAIVVNTLKEVVSGQTVEFVVNVVSNATTPLENVLLKAEYPSGFEVLASSPRATFDTNIWNLGDIPSGEKQTVRIEGRLIGQDNEERTFRFSSGTQSESNEREITAAFGTAVVPVTIKRPFIAIDVALNGDASPEYIARSNETIRADITWKNNLSTRVTDGKIIVSLDGLALDKRSVSVDKGFYRSSDNTITWSRETNDALAELDPGESGRVSFTFSPARGTTILNPLINLEASVEGRRLSEDNVPERIESTTAREVKVATDFLLNTRAVRTTGPFTNTGPIPPKADQESTYTVVWTLTNSANDVANAVVSATLPSYVRWVNVVSGGENVTYNAVGGQVLWRAGEVPAGTGSTKAVKEVAFQIALTPSLSQVGTVPVLITSQRAEGFDRFVETNMSDSRSPLTTQLITDPNVSNNHAQVVE